MGVRFRFRGARALSNFLLGLLFVLVACSEDSPPVTSSEVVDGAEVDGADTVINDGFVADRDRSAGDTGENRWTDSQTTVAVGASATVRVSNQYILVGRTARHLTRSESSQYTLYAGVQ